MDITAIITALKARTVATFNERIAGAAEFKSLPETANLVMPAAYVIPLDDDAGEQQSENGYSQIVRDGFGVVVVMSNTPDERGQGSIVSVSALRAVLWAALLGWKPDASHGPVIYEGGQLLALDRARLYYQFEFSAATEITEADTYQAVANAALSAFTEANVSVDTIDPFDPNRIAAGATGPDGKIDATILVQVPQ